jgi:glycosyltransferase involved in cell wall biosynthesis
LGWKKAALRKAYTSADSLITVAPGVAESASRFYGIPLESFRIVSSPVDLERIDSCAKLPWTGLRLRPDRKHIVVIGRLSEEKGQNYLLQAVARYRADISSNFAPPIDLHIVGDGILRQELVGLARSLGIEDSVFFHGHLSDPFPLLKRCDLFVLPSLYEGLPNVLLEAMVCRIPILATNTEQGAGELLRRYPLGTLVPAGDAVALEKAMVDRFVTPDPWLSRLEPAREYVENHHSLKHWIEEMSDLFESICPQ